MATLQVRAIDDRLYSILGKKAKMDNRSISQEVIVILKEHLSEPRRGNASTATDKFLDMCGTWKDERSAEEIIADIRQNRTNSDRFKGDIF